MMLTRHDLAELSRVHGDELVLSVYVGRETSDPGQRGAWAKRLDGALGRVRSDIESQTPGDLSTFDGAADRVATEVEQFGRVLPHHGWSAFATEGGLIHSEGLAFKPPDLVRWRQGIFAAPYVRNLKGARPVIVALLDRWQARTYRYHRGELAPVLELTAGRSLADMSDVGMGKRATSATGVTGVRGATRTDAARRTLEEEARRLRNEVGEAVIDMSVDGAGVVLGGTRKAIRALRLEIEDKLRGRILEVPELSFDSGRADVLAQVGGAASELTLSRQSELLDACAGSPDRGSMGWNQTYRALAAGAVDALLLSREMIESTPDDADRLVRLALAQGADVEELGGELGERLHAKADGVAARLRFRLTS